MRSSVALSCETIEAGAGAASRAGAASPLDLVHLTRQTFGDKRLETELLRLFMRQAEQIGRNLELVPSERAAGQSDVDLIHLLAGSARAVGATRVAALASDAEAGLRHDVAAGVRLGEAERRRLRDAILSATGYIAELLDQG